MFRTTVFYAYKVMYVQAYPSPVIQSIFESEKHWVRCCTKLGHDQAQSFSTELHVDLLIVYYSTTALWVSKNRLAM